MTAAYTNIHGQPLSVSARDAVRALHPEAEASVMKLIDGVLWTVRRAPRSGPMGTGATEESAWRAAWSRMLADEVVKGSKA